MRLASAVIFAVFLSSCSEDPAPAKGPVSPKDAGTSTPKDSGSTAPKYTFDDGEGTGSSWSALYADTFGPQGRSSCAGAGTACHASAVGAASLSKFVCADEAGCRESMLGESGMVTDTDATKPENSKLVSVLRKERADGSCCAGTQPKNSNYVFHVNTLDRIKEWIKNGAAAD